jgi:hypothetical protein
MIKPRQSKAKRPKPKAKRSGAKATPRPAKKAPPKEAPKATPQGGDDETKMGRPSKYRPEFATQAKQFAKLGATDAEISRFLEIDTATLWRWKAAHPDFCNALKAGKDVADDRVQQSLFQRAVGYSHEAVKIFANPRTGENVVVPFIEHFAPDTTACIFWLKNRRKDEWRERGSQEPIDLTPEQLALMAPGADISKADEPGPASPRL